MQEARRHAPEKVHLTEDGSFHLSSVQGATHTSCTELPWKQKITTQFMTIVGGNLLAKSKTKGRFSRSVHAPAWTGWRDLLPFRRVGTYQATPTFHQILEPQSWQNTNTLSPKLPNRKKNPNISYRIIQIGLEGNYQGHLVLKLQFVHLSFQNPLTSSGFCMCRADWLQEDITKRLAWRLLQLLLPLKSD